MTVAKPYPFFDCDNHFYEPPEAMLRYMPKEHEKKFQYVQVNGRTKLAIDGHISEYIPNPTFEVVAAPGCHVEWYRGNNREGREFREFNVIEKHRDEFSYKTPGRYKLLEEHGLAGTLMFPTLASVIESRMEHDPAFCHAAVHALNLWIRDEWGIGTDDRIVATPVITLMDVDKAVEEAEWLISEGTRVVLIRPTYVAGQSGRRSMGSPEFDPVFARLAEAGVFVAHHSSDNGYQQIANWHKVGKGQAEMLPFKRDDPLSHAMDLNHLAVQHHLASMVCHGVFDRHPKLRVGYIETGVYWLYPLWERLELTYGTMPKSFKRHPHETILEHVWFHPFFEESVPRAVELLGADKILFGSDWPHPEGYAQPSEWIECLDGLTEEDKQKIMGANLMKLLNLAA